METSDVIFVSIVLAFGLFGLAAVRRRLRPDLQNWATVSWVAHVISGLLQIILYITVYPGGDAVSYAYHGIPVSEALAYDFGRIFPDVLAMFLHQPNHLPFEVLEGDSTGSMQAITVMLLYFFGNSMYAASVAVSMASFLSKYLVFLGLKPFVSEKRQPTIFVAVMMVPSFIFWTSALLKEPIAWVAFGPAFYGLSQLVQGKAVVRNSVMMAVSLAMLALIKPYILFTLVLAGSIWLVWSRFGQTSAGFRLSPFAIAGAAAFLMVGATLSLRLFPKLRVESVGESVSKQRRVMGKGGSGYDLSIGSDASGNESSSTAGQVLLAPFALVTALYRPFIVEVRNPIQFVNSLETLALLILSIQVVRRRRMIDVIGQIRREPLLVFALVFTLLVSVGTGLATSNLGTLSRYRAPMSPFFVLLLLRLRDPDAPELESADSGLPVISAA